MGMRKRKIDPRMIMLRDYIRSSGARIEEVSKSIGVTGRTIYNWTQGKGKISPLASGPLDRFLESLKLAIDCGAKK
jgi:DNA-binding XRE family transcriptional regulator